MWSDPQKENQMNENERKVVVRRMLLLIAVAKYGTVHRYQRQEDAERIIQRR